MPEVYWSCVFSMHPQTTREVKQITFSSGRLNLPHTVPESANFPSNDLLLDKCRSLLHDSYVVDENWMPNPQTHTAFKIQTSKLTGRLMLCDRYDEKSFWVAILTPEFEVVGVQRMITTHLLSTPTDLDVLGYDNCPVKLRTWISQYPEPVGETSRTAIHKNYQRKYFFVYLNYHVSSYMLNKKYWGCNLLGIGTLPQDRPHRKFLQLIQGTLIPDWAFKYDDKDPHSSDVFITYADKIKQGIEKIAQLHNGKL